MKLSERSIRKYIRRLIIETFYAGPQGDVMDKDQMQKQDPTFFDPNRYAKNQYGYILQPGAPPPDVPGESEIFSGVYNTRLIAGAKRDLAAANPTHVSKLGGLMGDPNTLNKLTFSEKDIITMPDITDQNIGDLKQALELLYVLGEDLYDYMEHIYKLKGTPFSDFLLRQPEDNLTQRGVGQKTVIAGDHPLKLFFTPVDTGQVGMGRSLIVGRVDRIITSALANLNNMTPIEFRDAVYPAVEFVVRKVYARMPHIQANKHNKDLDKALEAYLEAIHYVLAEVIGEINFGYAYNPEGNKQMIFIPSDPEVRKNLDKYVEGKDWEYGSEVALKAKIASAFRDPDVYDPITRSFVPNPDPIFRDLPDYYAMKFSVNPKEVGVLEENSSKSFDRRLKTNLGFGHGLPDAGISRDLGSKVINVYDKG